MIFDKLCGFAERVTRIDYKDEKVNSYAQLVRMVAEDASIFEMRGDEEVPSVDWDRDNETFVLPFRCSAAEYDLPTGPKVTALYDAVDEDDAVGLDVPRGFVDAYMDDAGMLVVAAGAIRGERTDESGDGFVIDMQTGKHVPCNEVDQYTDSKYNCTFMAHLEVMFLDDRKGGKVGVITKDALRLEHRRYWTEGLMNVVKRICYMMGLFALCSSSDRWIVETKTKGVLKYQGRAKKKKKPGHIARSNERPKYTPLHIGKIRELIPNAGSGPKQASPSPHLRRRHWRTYKAERYKFMKGKRQLIPAMWIGPKDHSEGNKHYRVMVDL